MHWVQRRAESGSAWSIGLYVSAHRVCVRPSAKLPSRNSVDQRRWPLRSVVANRMRYGHGRPVFPMSGAAGSIEPRNTTRRPSHIRARNWRVGSVHGLFKMNTRTPTGRARSWEPDQGRGSARRTSNRCSPHPPPLPTPTSSTLGIHDVIIMLGMFEGAIAFNDDVSG